MQFHTQKPVRYYSYFVLNCKVVSMFFVRSLSQWTRDAFSTVHAILVLILADFELFELRFHSVGYDNCSHSNVINEMNWMEESNWKKCSSSSAPFNMHTSPNQWANASQCMRFFEWFVVVCFFFEWIRIVCVMLRLQHLWVNWLENVQKTVCSFCCAVQNTQQNRAAEKTSRLRHTRSIGVCVCVFARKMTMTTFYCLLRSNPTILSRSC